MSKPLQNPLMRTARLLDLVPYLASHQGIELSRLAEDFSISEQQLIADLTTLWMCGLPGYTPLELMDLSFESGFVTIRNAQTLANPRMLSDEETIALLLGLDLVIESLPIEREDLRLLAMELVAQLSRRIDVPTKLSAKPSIPGSIRAIINDALKSKRSVEITYHSFYSDTISKRVIFPLELFDENGYEYLRAQCHLAQGIRIFRLDRIDSGLLGHAGRTESGVIDEKIKSKISYTLRAYSRQRQIRERFSIQEKELVADLPVVSYSREWIKRSVLASSGSVEVLEPVDIRNEIYAAASLLLKRYQA